MCEERRLQLRSEFAAVQVELDTQANGPRLKITDLKSGKARYLDPLELEMLAWQPFKDIIMTMDPGRLDDWQLDGGF